jgi:cell wall-associated NlpC family hydrolase
VSRMPNLGRAALRRAALTGAAAALLATGTLVAVEVSGDEPVAQADGSPAAALALDEGGVRDDDVLADPDRVAAARRQAVSQELEDRRQVWADRVSRAKERAARAERRERRREAVEERRREAAARAQAEREEAEREEAERERRKRAERDDRDSQRALASAADSADSGRSDSARSSGGSHSDAVAIASTRIGMSYRYGAGGPTSFDCSGLTRWTFAKLGISLPHSSAAQRAAVRRISSSEKRPGDLVFVHDGGGGSVSHVAIYAGDGYWVEAANPRSGVRKAKAWTSNVSYGRP